MKRSEVKSRSYSHLINHIDQRFVTRWNNVSSSFDGGEEAVAPVNRSRDRHETDTLRQTMNANEQTRQRLSEPRLGGKTVTTTQPTTSRSGLLTSPQTRRQRRLCRLRNRLVRCCRCIPNTTSRLWSSIGAARTSARRLQDKRRPAVAGS